MGKGREQIDYISYLGKHNERGSKPGRKGKGWRGRRVHIKRKQSNRDRSHADA